MALNIKSEKTDRLARRLAELTGESLTSTVHEALRQRLEREERRRGRCSVEELVGIARRIASRPVHDSRSSDEILGYDERGLPH
jgi:antitoxin VapB